MQIISITKMFSRTMQYLLFSLVAVIAPSVCMSNAFDPNVHDHHRRLIENCPVNLQITHDKINNIWSAPSGWIVSQINNNIPFDVVPPDALLSRQFDPYRIGSKLVDITCSYQLDKQNVLILKRTYEQNLNRHSYPTINDCDQWDSSVHSIWEPSHWEKRCFHYQSNNNYIINYYTLGIDYALAIEASWTSREFVNQSSHCGTIASIPEQCSWAFFSRTYYDGPI